MEIIDLMFVSVAWLSGAGTVLALYITKLMYKWDKVISVYLAKRVTVEDRTIEENLFLDAIAYTEEFVLRQKKRANRTFSAEEKLDLALKYLQTKVGEFDNVKLKAITEKMHVILGRLRQKQK